MIKPADYHMHTPLCRHAVGEPADYAAAALARGLTEIGFSDHAPMRQDNFDEWRMNAADLDDYLARVAAARTQHPGLTIRIGLEVDWIPGHESWIRELAARHPWDYFIGSVHYVADGWDIDNPHKLEEWRRRDAGDVWRSYIDRMCEAAESGLFQILGHLDLPKKFGFYPRGDFLPLFERLLDVARRADVAIELNTAGLRKDCREIYPSRAILERAQAKRVAITFGSDAHAPSEVGQDLDQAVALARAVGLTHWCRLTRLQRQLEPLPATWAT